MGPCGTPRPQTLQRAARTRTRTRTCTRTLVSVWKPHRECVVATQECVVATQGQGRFRSTLGPEFENCHFWTFFGQKNVIFSRENVILYFYKRQSSFFATQIGSRAGPGLPGAAPGRTPVDIPARGRRARPPKPFWPRNGTGRDHLEHLRHPRNRNFKPDRSRHVPEAGERLFFDVFLKGACRKFWGADFLAGKNGKIQRRWPAFGHQVQLLVPGRIF